MPTGKAIVHWIGCINAIKMIFGKKWQITAYTLQAKNFELALSCTVYEIFKDFSCLWLRFHLVNC